VPQKEWRCYKVDSNERGENIMNNFYSPQNGRSTEIL